MQNVTRKMQLFFAVFFTALAFAAPGIAQTTLMTQSFENGGSVPNGWATEVVSAGNTISFVTSTSWPAGYTAYNGSYLVMFNSFTVNGGINRLKMTSPISTVGFTNVAVDFAWLESSGYAGVLDRVDVQWSTNGTTWTTAGTFNRYNPVQGWKIKTQALPIGAQGVSTLYIAFLFTSAYGNDCYLDFTHITATGPPPPATITVGNGTTSCNYPYSTSWMGGRTQLLYTAAQLNAAGASPGQLTSIGFDVISNSTQTMQNFNINLANTPLTTIPAWQSGLQSCYSGNYAVAGTGWQMITLQTPFVWDGTNLLVEVCFGNNGSYTNYSPVNGTTASSGQIYPYWNDNLVGCSYTGAPYTGNTALPNLRFVEQPYVGGITGTVTNCYNNAPLAGVLVTCGTYSAVTNASGVYTMINIPIGTYTVTYILPGFLTVACQANILQNQITVSPCSCMNPIPGFLSGIVYSAATGNPIIGAKITVGSAYTYSTGPNGAYTVNVYPPGTFAATCTKAGYDNATAGPFTFTPNNTITYNWALGENVNTPANIEASLNISQNSVSIGWQVPNGNYELLYDDGIQENFTVWAVAGNFNAVKFTPVGYPCTINGGKINIGAQSNYPGGSSPLVPFDLFVYDATGPNGTPGTAISGPFTFTPTSYGWNSFTFSTPVNLSSGDFFLVQKQGGNAPNAAGIAIDTTITQLRSYQKFATGSGTWVTSSGNFLMRAMMYGPNGPVPQMGGQVLTGGVSSDAPQTVTGYQTWRLLQGQEATPAAWVNLGTATNTNIVDNSWPTLPCNPYRWAVKTQYTGNRWSAASFSNVLGKCWTAVVTIHVGVSCAIHNGENTTVKLQNVIYLDTLYQALLDSTGTIIFDHVWKGTYTLTVGKFGYTTYTQGPIAITGDMTINVQLQQVKNPPVYLTVNDKSLLATWEVPRDYVSIFFEDWSSGSFATNGWTLSTGSNFQISTVIGNPAPSLIFNWSPQVLTYSQYVTSKVIEGVHSPTLLLRYDIYLSNFQTTNENTMAVELWDGTTWHVLKNYTNLNGNIPWTSETLDISAYTDISFKIRFHAAGVDSQDINNWNIDNIDVVASDFNYGINPCVLGYNVYLNNILSAFVTDTVYNIPCNQVQYGQVCTFCVSAVYASGVSPKICKTFTAHYLSPPMSLTVTGVEDVAYLTWTKPLCNGAVPAGLMGYKIYRSQGGTGGPWVMIKQLTPYPDSLSWYDYNLDPGKWCYRVTSYYDLSSFGFPGQFDESLPSGPACVDIVYGNTIPTCEDWGSGTFVFNEWEFGPEGQGNWIINTGVGNTAPSADFGWQPVRQNYSYSLVSQVIDASAWSCATVWLDFDYKLVDLNMTFAEKLSLELYYNSHWHPVEEYANSGSIDWTSMHIDISDIKGKAFRYRFRANGVNSGDMMHWYLDNLCVYGVGKKPQNFEAMLNGFNVTLSWTPPECGNSQGNLMWFIFDDGSMENGWGINPGYNSWIGNEFPIASNIQGVIKQVNYMFWSNPAAGNDQLTIDFFDASHSLIGSTNPFNVPDDVWDSVTVNDVPFSGLFYAMVHWNMTAGATNWLGYDENGPYASQDLETYYDGNTWSKLTTAAGANPGVCLVRVLALVAGDMKTIELGAGQSITGVGSPDPLSSHGQGNFDSGDHRTMQEFLDSESDSSVLLGYNIYRTEGTQGTGPFVKRNSTLINGTNYVDTIPSNAPLGSVFKYFVGAWFGDGININIPVFESYSDTIGIVLYTGIDNEGGGKFSVYPNPVRDWILIKSVENIKSVEFSNLMGQILYKEESLEDQNRRINVSTLDQGLYLLKVATSKRTQIVKILIVH